MDNNPTDPNAGGMGGGTTVPTDQPAEPVMPEAEPEQPAEEQPGGTGGDQTPVVGEDQGSGEQNPGGENPTGGAPAL